MAWRKLVGLALAASLAAAAIFAGRNPDFEDACGADATLFCPGELGGQLVGCLAQNQSKLSPKCSYYGASLWPCAAEAQAQCALSDVGNGSLKQCLMSRPQALSPACLEGLKLTKASTSAPR